MKIKKLKPYQIGLVAFALILFGFLAGTGAYCVVNEVTPAELVQQVVGPNEEDLIGKWQGEKAITGYEFHDDGTYENYMLGFSTSKIYEVKGNKLTLRSNTDGRKVVYKYKIKDNTLTLTLIESEGKERDGSEQQVYKKVEHFNFKSASEAIQDIAGELNTEEATTE